MSLLRLLRAGKSLVGMDKVATRYRMHPHFLLPKFGTGKNPFASPPPSQAVRPAEVASPAPAWTMSPDEIAAANLKETKRLPTATPSAATSAESTPAPLGTQPGGIARWIQKLNVIAWWNVRRSAAKPAVPRFARVPLQGELSLDRVTVVRNDLSDADVEIVPAKAGVEPKPKPVEKAQADLGLLKT